MRHLVLALVLAAPAAADTLPCAGPECERLLEIKAAYERAIAENKPELLEPFLKDDFSGSMLFQGVDGREGLRRLFAAAAKDIGRNHAVKGYKVKLKPTRVSIVGDRVDAEGTTEETVESALGSVTFASSWRAGLVREAGGWKLARIDSTPDPGGSLGAMVKRFVDRVWKKPAFAKQYMPKQKAHVVAFQADRDPEYDGWRRDLRR